MRLRFEPISIFHSIPLPVCLITISFRFVVIRLFDSIRRHFYFQIRSDSVVVSIPTRFSIRGDSIRVDFDANTNRFEFGSDFVSTYRLDSIRFDTTFASIRFDSNRFDFLEITFSHCRYAANGSKSWVHVAFCGPNQALPPLGTRITTLCSALYVLWNWLDWELDFDELGFNLTLNVGFN